MLLHASIHVQHFPVLMSVMLVSCLLSHRLCNSVKASPDTQANSVICTKDITGSETCATQHCQLTSSAQAVVKPT